MSVIMCVDSWRQAGVRYIVMRTVTKENHTNSPGCVLAAADALFVH